jgi:hypothetical protein
MREELQLVLTTVSQGPVEDLPRLLGELREVETAAMVRLMTPTQSSNGGVGVHHADEQLLDVEETAKRLKVSEDYLYRHWKKLPFARKYDWGLRFSAHGVDEYIRLEASPLYTRPRRGGPR